MFASVRVVRVCASSSSSSSSSKGKKNKKHKGKKRDATGAAAAAAAAAGRRRREVDSVANANAADASSIDRGLPTTSSAMMIRHASHDEFDATADVSGGDGVNVPIVKKRAVKEIKKAILEAEYLVVLDALQQELVTMQTFVKAKGQKVCVIFEGRDAAGKGGCISRITEVVSPRGCRVVALSAPTVEEKSQWYFQRYVKHLPSAGEIVLFDRSWYNRSGVERVMGFATEEEVARFEREVIEFERMLVDSGIVLIKLWFDVSAEEQERRFKGRIEHSDKRWKLSPMDLYARSKWYDYAKARDAMFENTSATVKWSVVPADDKRIARLNAIQHILSSVDYEEIPSEPLVLPPQQKKPKDYVEKPFDERFAVVVPQVYTTDKINVSVEGRDWADIADVVVDKAKKEFKQLSVDLDETSWPK